MTNGIEAFLGTPPDNPGAGLDKVKMNDDDRSFTHPQADHGSG